MERQRHAALLLQGMSESSHNRDQPSRRRIFWNSSAGFEAYSLGLRVEPAEQA
jgi:hypothetical protein